MKKVFILITFLIAYNFSNAQTKGWTKINQDPNLFEQYVDISTITSDKNGNIYAAFNNADYFIGIWDGNSWNKLGDLNVNGYINSIAVDDEGNVYAAGAFTNQYWDYYVVKWDGKTWSKVGGENDFLFNDPITDIVITSTGTMYASGFFTDVYGFPYITKWDGVQATNIRTEGDVSTIALDKNDSLYISVDISTPDMTGKMYIIEKLKGSTFAQISSSSFSSDAINYFNNSVLSIVFDQSNNIYLAGAFTNSTGKYFVATLVATYWKDLGSLDANAYINTLTIDKDGKVYAAGKFKNGNNYNYIAQWNGSTWNELGTGSYSLKANNEIGSLTTDNSGNIYAAGQFTDDNQLTYVAEYTDITATSVIKKKNDDSQISVYPNPVSGYVNFKCSENGHLNLINTLGETVFSHNVDAGLSYIDLTRFTPGNYTLLFNGANSSYTETLVIK